MQLSTTLTHVCKYVSERKGHNYKDDALKHIKQLKKDKKFQGKNILGSAIQAMSVQMNALMDACTNKDGITGLTASQEAVVVATLRFMHILNEWGKEEYGEYVAEIPEHGPAFFDTAEDAEKAQQVSNSAEPEPKLEIKNDKQD